MVKAAQSAQNRGFTLIELLVTTAITSIILLSATTILMTFFLSNTRSTVRRQIKAEGNRALSRMEFVIREGESCSSNADELIIVDLQGNTTTFSKSEVAGNITMTPPTPSEKLISAFSLPATSAQTELSCITENNKQYVQVDFTVTNNAGSTTAITERFSSFTVLRNSK